MDIRELHLLTSDLTRQLHFYVDRLSLPVVAVRPDSLVLQVGTTRLTFKQAPLEAHQIYHFAFNVPPRQLLKRKPGSRNVSHFSVITPEPINSFSKPGMLTPSTSTTLLGISWN